MIPFCKMTYLLYYKGFGGILQHVFHLIGAGESPVTIRDETRLFPGAGTHSVTKVPMNIIFVGVYLLDILWYDSKVKKPARNMGEEGHR